MAARLKTIVAIAMLALYDEFDTYWQNGGYKKISDIIFAECHIFIVSNLCPYDHKKRKTLLVCLGLNPRLFTHLE
jgi:hypothetical protein